MLYKSPNYQAAKIDPTQAQTRCDHHPTECRISIKIYINWMLYLKLSSLLSEKKSLSISELRWKSLSCLHVTSALSTDGGFEISLWVWLRLSAMLSPRWVMERASAIKCWVQTGCLRGVTPISDWYRCSQVLVWRLVVNWYEFICFTWKHLW